MSLRGGSSKTPLESSQRGHSYDRVMCESKLTSSRRKHHRFFLRMAAENAAGGLQRLPGSSRGWVLITGTIGQAVLRSRRWTGAGQGLAPNRQRVTGWEQGATDQPQPKISCDRRRVPGATGITVSGTREHHPPRGVWGTVQRPQKSMCHSVKTAALTWAVVCLLQKVKSGRNNKNRDCKASCMQN